jgi:uncharacterized iron-regulated protein
MTFITPTALAALLLLGACGGSYPAPKPAAPAATGDAPTEAPESAHARVDIGPDGVEAAALPFRLVHTRGGREAPLEPTYDALVSKQAICIGETHDNPHDHWAQLHLIDVITTRAAAQGISVAVGMEMFQRPFQGVLEDYAAKRIDADTLMSRSGWDERWGYDFDFYRPLIDLAVERGAALLGLNVSTELRKKISKDGLDKLTPAERARVPELALDDPAHRAWWDQIMSEMSAAHGSPHGHHGGHHAAQTDEEKAERALRAERMYRTQVLWDETMADTAARWVSAEPKRLVIILAGNGHCHDAGIIRRLARRNLTELLSIYPVVDDGEGNVASLVAEPNTDLLFVMSRPKPAAPAH